MSYKLSKLGDNCLGVEDKRNQSKTSSLKILICLILILIIMLDCAGGHTGAANAADRGSLVAVATEAAAAAHCV